MAIPNEIITKIKNSLKLEDIVAKYVPLYTENQSSPWLSGNCPFHDEKDSSFKVNKVSQTWHCWGCLKGSKQDGNLGSDVIAFIQEINNVGFEEAILLLGKEADIEVILEKEDPKVIAEKLKKTKESRRYYQHLWDPNNQDSIKALEYLKNRGLTEDTIKEWRLGLVPKNEIKYRTDIANIAGKISFAMIENKNIDKPSTLSMSYRSPFSNYEQPKYKNDHNSIAFTKNDFLYGMNFASKNIKSKGYGIILECYFSTLMLHQIGMNNSVSIMGTSLKSFERINQMKKYSKNWILMLDNDKAGYNGMVAALPYLLKENINVDVVLLPEGVDADELIVKIGKDKFILWFNENRRSLLDLVLDNKLNKYEEEVRKMKIEILTKTNHLIETLTSPKLEVYRAMINKRLDI